MYGIYIVIGTYKNEKYTNAPTKKYVSIRITGGVLALITGVLGLWAGNRGVAISIAVLGSFSLIVAVIGSVVDGIAASVFGQLKACVNLGTEEIYGDASDVNIAAGALCANLYIYDYADTSCLCVDGGLSSGCYFYELANPSDTCDIILTSYVDNLSASTAFAALVAVLSLVISIIACVNSCSKTASRVQDDKVLRQVPVPIVVISQAQDTNQKSLATVSIATAA